MHERNRAQELDEARKAHASQQDKLRAAAVEREKEIHDAYRRTAAKERTRILN